MDGGAVIEGEHVQVAEKKATFEQLAQENLVLRARTNILEKVGDIVRYHRIAYG